MKHRALEKNRDFVRVYRRGKSFVHPHVVVYVNKNRLGITRVGITASKKVGNAVVRNRARRVIRHALADVLPPEVGGVDLVFVARGRTAGQKSHALSPTLKALLVRAGVLPKAPNGREGQR
ncbi:MAG: ribonuclease P protein component [Oscillospiraceae bacterium]